MMKTKMLLMTFLIFSWIAYPNDAFLEEGMYPISEIHKLDLRAKGLKIDAKDIFNPDGISLIDGIVQVGGCTGSFVSGNGLILTNHHCAFGAAQAASTREHDYIRDGFRAANRAEEIPARGYTVRITESYRDVSGEVLSAVNDKMGLAERAKAIEKKIKEIEKATEAAHPGKRADISEMFIGRTYVLFIYTYLKDVRLVYVPPRSIGEFGGEIDNWEWPRHTGDFSFMRAYVAPNGEPAEYAPENVPYHPRKFISVAPEGANESDFVFILGYPGRTARHQTAAFVAYEQETRLPYIVDLYDWEISLMEKMGEKDRAVALKHASRIKGLANVLKRSRGQLRGLQREHIVARKRDQEAALQKFIDSDKKRRQQYGHLIDNIAGVYQEMQAHAQFEINMQYLLNSCHMLDFGYRIYEAAIERRKPDIERESAYMDRNFDRTKEQIKLALANYYEPTDRTLLKTFLTRLLSDPEGQRVPGFAELAKASDRDAEIDAFVSTLYDNTKLADAPTVLAALEKTPDEVNTMHDPFIQLAATLYPTYQELKETNKRRTGALGQLYAQFIEIKQQFLQTDFIPDANRTLRLTYGHIRGYSPADAITMHPITTLQGVIDKTTGVEPFDTPQKLLDLYKARDFGRFVHPKLQDVPVAILYDTDTTGGNSGSPVLNARGQLVGVNFDRTFDATINDFAWSEAYSRSIAVDIRYVLWVLQKFAGANDLLDEMGVAAK